MKGSIKFKIHVPLACSPVTVISSTSRELSSQDTICVFTHKEKEKRERKTEN